VRRCEHRIRRKDKRCTHCLVSEMRRLGVAGVCCALCDTVGHPAKYCPNNRIGRIRLFGARGQNQARGACS
jgi:hypothetical protein